MNALWSRGLVHGATVLDLFAGSGALGIEALSRGAARVVFVDQDARARQAVNRNLAACGFDERAEVAAEDAERYARRCYEHGHWFDLVFCDPPYAYDRWAPLLGVLPAGVVVMESGQPVDLPEAWEMVRSTQYGTTWIGFAARHDMAARHHGR